MLSFPLITISGPVLDPTTKPDEGSTKNSFGMGRKLPLKPVAIHAQNTGSNHGSLKSHVTFNA